MTGFQSREPFRIEAGDEMRDGIATFPPYKPGGIGKGMTFCHGKHFCGMDHLISRHRQRTTELF